MRVAVYPPHGHPAAGVYPDGHERAGEPVDEPRPFAFRLGRIEEGVHNAPVGHEAIPIGQFVSSLVEQAKAEYPDCDVRVERLVDNGDDTASWVDSQEFDPEQHTALGAGNIKSTEVHVTSEQSAGGAA